MRSRNRLGDIANTAAGFVEARRVLAHYTGLAELRRALTEAVGILRRPRARNGCGGEYDEQQACPRSSASYAPLLGVRQRRGTRWAYHLQRDPKLAAEPCPPSILIG